MIEFLSFKYYTIHKKDGPTAAPDLVLAVGLLSFLRLLFLRLMLYLHTQQPIHVGLCGE